jgi:hypothetical protein
VAFGARSMAQASACRFRARSRAKRRGEGEGRLSSQGRRTVAAGWRAAPRSFQLKEVTTGGGAMGFGHGVDLQECEGESRDGEMQG